MDVGKIKDLGLAHPFRPFYLLIKDGERLFVEHPLSLGIASDDSHLLYNSRTDKRSRHFGESDVKDVDVLPRPLKN
jgi:hypothetical protein